ARAAARRSWLPLPAARWLSDNFLLLLVPYLGLAVAVLSGAAWPALGFALLAIGFDWAATREDSAVARIVDTAGAVPPLRAAVTALLLAGTLAGPGRTGFVAVAVVVVLAWVGLTGLATGFSRSAPPLRFVPGAATQPEPLAGYARFYRSLTGTPGPFALALALAMVGGILAASNWAGWLLLAAAALVALGTAATSGLAFRRLLGRAEADTEALLAELAGGQPRYLVHVSLGAGQSRYIVNQWLPVLDATPANGLLAVREASQLAPLRATRVPVVYAPSPRNLERVTLPGIPVAFYLAYGERNAHLLRDPSLAHVMLLHGDSDKATSANAQARGFDEVWVAGQAAVARDLAAGVDLAPDRFVVVGRPQVEPLLRADHVRAEPPVVFYAPTFEGYYQETAHSSLDTMGPALVRHLLAHRPEVRVWFKPHPASGVVRSSMLAAISEIEGLLAGGDHVVVDRTDLSLVDCLARADVLVSDVSSVVSDFLATRRPVLVTNPAGLAPDEFTARYPSQRGSYLVGPDLAGFDDLLTAALGDDPLRTEREALVGYLLGDLPDGPQAAFDAALARISARTGDGGA
ncbi:MAG: CDP-glycerol glycerophosphotransferase family protein, partial [Propionicimonas sp.]